jgi:hypothetical protein
MAANALRSKILYDFHELPDSPTRVSFFQSLLTNVTNFAAGPQLVRTRLALCVASLAVHVAGSGEMHDVLNVLMQTYGSNPEYALVLLDIMTVVPEECANKKLNVADPTRATAAQNFAAHTAQILRMIMAFLESTGTDRVLQKKVGVCVCVCGPCQSACMCVSGCEPLLVCVCVYVRACVQLLQTSATKVTALACIHALVI